MPKIKIKKDEEFMYYPDLEDDDFYKKIYIKKEFNKNKIPKLSKSVDELCNPTEFTLAPQQNFLKNYISIETPYNGVLIFHGVGVGKCHAIDTPIAMSNGLIKMVQDIKVGDLLMGDDSTHRRVINLIRGYDDMYEIIPKYGNKFIVNADHILCLKDDYNNIIEISVRDYLEKCKNFGKLYKNTIEFGLNMKITYDPYFYALKCRNKLEYEYKFNSRDVRANLLIGLIDAYGRFDNGVYEFQIGNIELEEDLLYLINSLGYFSYKQDNKIFMINSNVMEFNIKYIGKDNYYGFTIDGNHRYLLGDFTVTHNSCAAISIAEQFKDYMRKYNKKILVILKKNIQKGFLKQIYDIDKEKTRKDDVVQCTGDTYELSEEDKFLTRDQKKRKIKAMIKQNYKFVGYEQFANEVLRKTDWDGELNNLTPEIIKKIIKEYSNRIIIIDEVHHINIKKTTDVNIKKVPPILETIIKYSKNVRLIMMSATPMYDKPEEIVYLLNLLLLNDKRDPIKISDVFDNNGNLKPDGEKYLNYASRGYVSYLRGENPITFPIRLYSPNAVVPNIKYDINGNLLDKDEKMRYLRLILCNMSDFQYKWYKSILSGTKVKEEENNVELNESIEDKKKDIGLKNLIYASNIVYPTKGDKAVFAKYGITSSDDGNGSLYKITQIINKKKRVIFKYQNHVIFDKGTKDEEPFLSLDHLDKYSDKFYNALNYIIEAKGIIFIYSRYLAGGVIPFSLAMEQNGIQRYEIDGDKQLLDYKSNSKGGGGKTNPICYYCGKFASDPIHKPENPKYHKWYAAKYMLLTGDKSLTRVDIGKAMEIINNKDNMNGQQVKVIIGNEAISEGIDFHRIRQVHILEPWYNISSLEQIIGRAIRNCSHKTLPEKDRNVEIFLYASVAPKGAPLKERETETIDERNYRISELKDVKIKNVEYVLKKSAVDCLLNKNGNVFKDNKEITVETSSGHRVKHNIGDEPYSRICDYRSNCDYKCVWQPPDNKELKINEDTYNLIFAKGDIELAKKYIKKMFRKNIIYELGVIVDEVRKHIPTIENKYIYKALDEIVNNKNELVYDKFNREGYLIYRGKYYIYQPKDITDESIPLYYRNTPIPIKTKKLPLINYTVEKEEKEVVENSDILDKIELKMREYGNRLERVMKNNNISVDKGFIAILGMVLDRLNENEIIVLLKDLIVRHNKKMIKDGLEKDILEYYVDNLFLDTLVTDKKKKLASEILGFRFNNKYYCLRNNIWSICSDDIRKKLELLDKVLKSKERVEGNLVGLITHKKNETIFQIIDRKKYTEIKTVTTKKSKRSEIKGRVCETYSTDILQNFVRELGMKDERGKKETLCLSLELYFRLKDNADSQRKWLQNNIKN